MPSLSNVRQEEAVRAFVRAGGWERSGKGGHRVIKMPNGKNVSLPSGILKKGLLQHQIKMADLTEERFLSLL